MTIKELMKALSEYDPNRMVVVNGYEGGFDEVITVSTIDIKLNVYCQEYMGAHEEVREAKKLEDTNSISGGYSQSKHLENFNGKIVNAVLIDSKRRK